MSVSETPRSPKAPVPAHVRPGCRVAIVGSRAFPDLRRVRRFVADLAPGTVIVSGGAPGVDCCAAAAGRSRHLTVVEHFAQWNLHGRRAGFLRNALIVRDCDCLVAFWDGRSPGTRNALYLARQAFLPFAILRP